MGKKNNPVIRVHLCENVVLSFHNLLEAPSSPALTQRQSTMPCRTSELIHKGVFKKALDFVQEG
jgi:hypothetical protein